MGETKVPVVRCGTCRGIVPMDESDVVKSSNVLGRERRCHPCGVEERARIDAVNAEIQARLAEERAEQAERNAKATARRTAARKGAETRKRQKERADG